MSYANHEVLFLLVRKKKVLFLFSYENITQSCILEIYAVFMSKIEFSMLVN
jgi:hypothetical protein